MQTQKSVQKNIKLLMKWELIKINSIFRKFFKNNLPD